jgi:hypothetical protein
MIPFTLIFWYGTLLFRNGLLAKHLDCCCTEVDGCCGRLSPGGSSLEGAAYYPLVLHVRITKGTCTLPDPPIEFDLTWNASLLVWENTSISLGDGTYSLTTMRLNCEEPNWSALLTGGICGCDGVGGSCTFDMVPTLTSGECNPVDLNGTATMIGLNCCGSLGGGSVTVEAWE